MRILEQIEGAEGVEHPDEALTATLAEAADLPAPRRVTDPFETGTPDEPAEAPLPPGYRRRVDRDALRRARQRRGR
jgi:hypothetical protein